MVNYVWMYDATRLMLLVYRSCLICFNVVTFGNESNHDLSRELVGDELLISAVDVINVYNSFDTRKIN